MKVILPEFVRSILTTFLKSDYEIYIVGGIVRDLLMDKKGNDWDFTTNARPEQITALFKSSFYDNKFGTVGVIDPNEIQKNPCAHPSVYQITTFRKEIGYSDKRHPDKVEWGKTLDDDLIRRDFTINAMALKPEANSSSPDQENWEMEIIDPHQGQTDLKTKLIKAVGDPNERFTEDALRMMRAIRFSAQLNFKIDPETFLAIKNNLSLLDHVSWERIRDELLKMLSYPNAADGYRLLHESGLAKKILPEVEQGYGVKQKSPGRHHIHDVWTHSVLSLQHCTSANPIVRLASLAHDIGKPLTVNREENDIITFYNHEYVGEFLARKIARRLKLSRLEQEKLVKLVRWHQFTVDERQTDKAVRRFIRNVGKENLEDILAVRTADRLGGGAKETSWRLEKFKEKLIKVQKQPFGLADLKINGTQIMKILQTKPGPLVGQILNTLFEEIEDNKDLNNKEYLEKRVKEIKDSLQNANG